MNRITCFTSAHFIVYLLGTEFVYYRKCDSKILYHYIVGQIWIRLGTSNNNNNTQRAVQPIKILKKMSFFRRRSFSLRRNSSRQARNKYATTKADVSQDQVDPESPTRHSSFEHIDGDQKRDELKLSLPNYVQAPRDIDSRLYIVINVPAWEDCVVRYPTSTQVAALMSKLQSVS